VLLYCCYPRPARPASPPAPPQRTPERPHRRHPRARTARRPGPTPGPAKDCRPTADDVGRYLALGRDIYTDINAAARVTQARALDLARALAHDLDSHELDASGEDLSSIQIQHLDAIDGITWTRQTTWPPAIANQVEEHSTEIRPGLYQIHHGDTRDRRTLLTHA
jgi:hypothetical protein